MTVTFEVLPRPNDELRVRAVVGGLQVVWRTTSGWRCRCGKNAPAKHCRHVRAVGRELPEQVLDRIEAFCQPLGWRA